MMRIGSLLLLLASACVTSGKNGHSGGSGGSGPPGPAGPPGEGIVFKDATGAVVEDAFPTFHDHTFTMIVTNANGVFFVFSPLTGAPVYSSFDSSSQTPFYLTSNCTGDVL